LESDERLGVASVELPEERFGAAFVELPDERLGVADVPDDGFRVPVPADCLVVTDELLEGVAFVELPDERLGVVPVDLPDERFGAAFVELPDDRLGVADVPEDGFRVPVPVDCLVVADELLAGVLAEFLVSLPED
jgi:hypothetical protein